MSASDGGGSSFHHFVAGGLGGSFSVMSGHPFDTIKVRLQTMHHAEVLGQRSFNGLLDCAMQTVRHEGARGLFKGLMPPLLASVPANACFFMGSAFGRSFFNKKEEKELASHQLFVAGCFGGFSLALVTTPVERIKCILQTRQEVSTRSQIYCVWDCGHTIFRREGFKGFYRGLCVTFVRDIPSGGGFYMTYYAMLRALNRGDEEKSSKLKSALRVMAAGGTAGVVNWILAIAPDTLKSRVQTAPPGEYPRGARDAYKHLMATEGPRGLFHGLSAVLIRAFVSNAFCLLGFEIAISLLTRGSAAT